MLLRKAQFQAPCWAGRTCRMCTFVLCRAMQAPRNSGRRSSHDHPQLLSLVSAGRPVNATSVAAPVGTDPVLHSCMQPAED